MSDPRRRDTRYRVHLAVRYQVARDFVEEYAENLSKGGLFIRGAEDLEVRESVVVQISFPGYGSFKVVGEVAHVLTREAARAMGRHAGAGLAITRTPANYQAALKRYLRLLGRRRDCLVFCADEPLRAALQESGFVALLAPPPEETGAAIDAAGRPVVGLVVDPASEGDYAAATFASGHAHLVESGAGAEDLDRLLPLLDARIPRG